MHEVFGLVGFFDVPPYALYHVHEFPLPTSAAKRPEYYNQAPLQVGYLVDHIYFPNGEPPVIMETADVDCNSLTNISDVVYLIGYIFSGGLSPCSACP